MWKRGLTLEDHAELLDLCEQLNYDPEKIGIAVLQHCGFSVRVAMLSGDISVYDADGQFLNYIDSGAIVDRKGTSEVPFGKDSYE